MHEKGKVISSGKRGYSIYIPAVIARAFGLQRGDTVNIDYKPGTKKIEVSK